ncbi:41569_t:CDS:2 [Gigaspora margarita]|uniref:41569_t:CDS:1 n=1 Tax=Gigaspora margarita TaxID=4874 RepID=A0ABN7W9E4_GIGMA|nr:41569_t:CDS:2 [Gigaspora margarita]
MPKNNKKKTYQKPTQEQIQYLRDKSKVRNAEKSTLNWIQKFQKYRSDLGLEGAAEEVDNVTELEVQLHYLSEKRYGRSDALTFEEIITILSNEATSRDIPNNYEKYFSKRPVDANSEFYLYPISTKAAPRLNRLGQLKLKTFMRTLAEKTGINWSYSKTLVQRLKDMKYQRSHGIDLYLELRYERPKYDDQQFA